jgi:hypothetical protein
MGFGFGHTSHIQPPSRDSGLSERRKCEYSAMQGAFVVMVGCALIVGLAFGAMVALTGPDGWITRAANTALLGDSSAVLTAYASEQGGR